MAFTSAGLANGGQTAHYQISYDAALSKADGQDRANGLILKCEDDFALMTRWFGGLNLIFSFPLPVQIANASGGASWNDPSDLQVEFGTSPTITLSPGSGTPVSFLRYLLVSEVTEMFMASQKGGWFEDTSLFSGADEGSKGEGLSRFLGVQFQLENGLGNVPPVNFAVTSLWLNSPRNDFVNSDPDDHNPDPVSGCATLFLYYLHDQLGYGVDAIISAGAGTLAGVYKNLTGQADGWTPFVNMINSHYPSGFFYNPAGDSVFPVSTLTQFFAPNQITCGYNQPTQIFVDRPAMAEVNIQLTSGDPTLVQVPATVTVPVGAMSAGLIIGAAAIPIPFPPKTVSVQASYAGKTLTIAVEVVPPRIAALTLAPNTVTCGDSVIATVTLDRPSLQGPVAVDLVCGAPGFATVPAQVIVPQGLSVGSFVVTTPNLLIPFPTAHATIFASYVASSVSAVLTVRPKMIAGILNKLIVAPTEISIGQTSNGTVTLAAAVPVNTVLGLAVQDPTFGPGSGLPGHSTVATVPPSITIPAGATTGSFTIHTIGAVPPGVKRRVQIMAGGIVIKYATLTVTA
jgi:hypothetical protein